jgi:DNA-binding MarR family transcriptional regulator
MDVHTSFFGGAMMDITQRNMTKISREVNRFINLSLRGSGVGTAEYEFLHAVRKHPGITQAGIRELLGLDKGASARRAANLAAKGFLIRMPDPTDRRSSLLYATERANLLKSSRAHMEARFYEWLLSDLTEDQRAEFAATLNLVYQKCKQESRSGFSEVSRFLSECDGDFTREL